MKTQCYRHGEICFEIIKELPTGLKKEKQKEIKKGSHGNSHSYDKGELYFKNENEYIFGYFVAKDTTLTHPEHGEGGGKLRKAKLPDNIYRLRHAVERVNGELKQVID